MNLLRKLFPNRRLQGEDRFRSTHYGSILDSERGNSPVIIMKSDFLVSLADNMATQLGPDVLRTLRFAASDEWRETLEQSVFSWRGDDPEKWKGFDRFWRDEGHYDASIIVDGALSKYVVETTVPTPIAAGNFAAALEFAIGNPIRVGVETQSQRTAFLSIQVKERIPSDTFPPPKVDNHTPVGILTPLYIDGLEFGKQGGIRRLGQNYCVVPIRLFDHWELASTSLAKIADNHDKTAWEMSLCTAVSTAFVESGELVFIENEESWEQVSSLYFSRWGFGKIHHIQASEDSLIFAVKSDANPCIVAGLLMGCIHRTTGKKIYPKWKIMDDNTSVKFDMTQ